MPNLRCSASHYCKRNGSCGCTCTRNRLRACAQKAIPNYGVPWPINSTAAPTSSAAGLMAFTTACCTAAPLLNYGASLSGGRSVLDYSDQTSRSCTVISLGALSGYRDRM